MNYAAITQPGNLGQIQAVRAPTLEQHLEFLRKNVESAQDIRRRVNVIAGQLRVSNSPEAGMGNVAQPAQDLLGRFGEELQFLCVNLEEMDAAVSRIENSLFDAKLDQVKRA